MAIATLGAQIAFVLVILAMTTHTVRGRLGVLGSAFVTTDT